MNDTRAPGQRAGLSQEAVLAASWDLLNLGGTSALTMRALARLLGVSPNAVYSYVANKTDLLDLLLDDLLSTVSVPPPDIDDPVAGLADLMTSTYQILTSHPDLVPLYLKRQGARGPHAIRLGVVMDDLLDRAGVDSAGAAQARRALIIHTIGSAAFATGASVDTVSDGPFALEQASSTFDRSLGWLLSGATQTIDRHDAPTAEVTSR